MADTRYSNLINTRFHDLLISYDFARKHNGAHLQAMADLFTEQEQRQLLDVELVAKNERDALEHAKEKHRQKKDLEINQLVADQVVEQLSDVDNIFENVLHIQDSIPAILDILSVRAANIGRIEPLVMNLPWLEQDMVQFVNLPGYRPTKEGKPIRVDKAKSALSYIGIDNLKMVVPTFAIRKWIPHSTEPFRLMKRKLWETGLGAAVSCKRLALIHNLDQNIAFTIGAFHGLGQSALVRMYLRTFDKVWKEQLEIARERRLKDDHEAISALEPSGEALRNIMLEHTPRLSAELIKRFDLKRFMIHNPMQEFAAGDIREMSPLALIMKKGICYSRYKLLQRHGLIAKHEAKIYFKENNFTAVEVAELNKLSMRRLNLRLEQQ
ncbi:HDOD domain-containing protein [Catenovulum sp. SX2]|uniref:HDOD domain-containing protein n=1 Tax=Catenovulum sp. SX2 TaxID=3398614 RepID=UPI003F85792D